MVTSERSDLSEMYHHIYNRGAHKTPIFQDGSDYWRMLKLLYIANNTESFVLDSFGNKDIFVQQKSGILVDIFAYCLMPNHIHIYLREVRPLGISKFIQKLSSGYGGYYNRKYDHSGTIWQGGYKQKPAFDEQYQRVLIDYIHLNPYGIITPDMTKEARSEHRDDAIAYSIKYEFSSLKDYLCGPRQQTPILFRGFREVRPLGESLQSPPPIP